MVIPTKLENILVQDAIFCTVLLEVPANSLSLLDTLCNSQVPRAPQSDAVAVHFNVSYLGRQ